jgi:hypothetical protein
MLILKNVNFLAIFATFSILQKVTKNGEKGKGVSLTSNNRALFYYFYPFFIFEKGAKKYPLIFRPLFSFLKKGQKMSKK